MIAEDGPNNAEAIADAIENAAALAHCQCYEGLLNPETNGVIYGLGDITSKALPQT